MPSESEGLPMDSVKVAFGKLRSGFRVSFLTVILFFIGLSVIIAFLELFFLGFGIVAIYFLGIYRRSAGWRLLGFNKTWITILVCAASLVFYFFFLIFDRMYNRSTIIYQFRVLLVWPPLIPWGLYTFVESHNLRQIEKRFKLDLKPARILALLGVLAVVASAVAITLSWTSSLLYFPCIVAISFLIASCVLLTERLKSRLASDNISQAKSSVRAVFVKVHAQ